jgi:predicted DNA-binding ribbon-helix-helix protein
VRYEATPEETAGDNMCDIYVSADPIHYEQRTRSMRIRGVVTSIRLENLCWDVLARIASKDQMTTNQLISQLYDEIIARQGRVDNLSSFLRVSCMRYLSYVDVTEKVPGQVHKLTMRRQAS